MRLPSSIGDQTSDAATRPVAAFAHEDEVPDRLVLQAINTIPGAGFQTLDAPEIPEELGLTWRRILCLASEPLLVRWKQTRGLDTAPEPGTPILSDPADLSDTVILDVINESTRPPPSI
jgi:hypothetical protein